MMGHRDAPDALYPQILAAAKNYAESQGNVEFIVGRYGHFDFMAAQAVIEIKPSYPGIILTQLEPYFPPKPLISGFDRSVSPPAAELYPRRFAIIKANQYIVSHCDALIIYAIHPASNTQNILEFAKQRIQQGKLHLFSLNKP